jgi:aminopeptidase N
MSAPKKIYLKDYQAPDFQVEALSLNFDLHEEHCLVTAHSKIKSLKKDAPLFLDGENLELIEIKINDQIPKYELRPHGLEILSPPDQFDLKIITKIKPQENTSLEGLYKSNGTFCTQCEAQGFRKITYFMDRPDVMTSYQVRIEADQTKYPVLLSNGNKLGEKNLPNGRHEVHWQDPFKKPCYLFALVAGDLGKIQDQFTTSSGKKVALEIYSAHGTQKRCEFAMQALKRSMLWDEKRFGREYDLSQYMIVAIDDFNAGAMENKGLNVFNSRLVFADPQTATDDDYNRIDSVIAHEYFHNWTGNRVTLRDWFHLSLKEGLTVFRDQEYSMDHSSRALVRIDNVDDLRNYQFSEDAGPNAHPIRPASCFAVDNFFTSTIYEKGAEVIRMMQTIVGRPGFRKGMDLYFKRHDGQAVIIEDFAKAIADANQQNWDQFKLWYSQAGTPKISVHENFDPAQKRYSLRLEQNCSLTSREIEEGLNPEDKKPFHIPLLIGLIDKDGKEIPLKSNSLEINSEGKNLIHLKKKTETFLFEDVSEKPVLSINREFSSPILVDFAPSTRDLILQSKFDSDLFNRWDAWQKVYLTELKNLIQAHQDKKKLKPTGDIIDAFSLTAKNQDLNPALKAVLMTMPSYDLMAQANEILDADAFLQAKESLRASFAHQAQVFLLQDYQKYHGKNIFSQDIQEIGNRRLKNTALVYLSYLPEYQSMVLSQLTEAKTMTDAESAFGILLGLESNLRDQATEIFYERYKNESLVLNKWFAAQASSKHAQTFHTVQNLMNHPEFNIKNPNRVYSLLRSFGDNLIRFHSGNGETYRFMSDQIMILDKLNPQVAARVAGSFDLWTKLPLLLKEKAHAELERLVRHGLSQNTHEIISNALKAKP